MNKSDSIVELASALLAFHDKMGKVKKDSTNPFYKSKYASLSNILGAIKQPLLDSELSVSQFPTGEHELTTMLIHTSGEFISGAFKMKPVKDDPQGIGSSITYQRRYALGAVLGLDIDEDDDANAASAPKTPTIEQKATPTPQTTTETTPTKGAISEKQGKRLIAIALGRGFSRDVVKEYAKSVYGYDHLRDIRWQDYEKIVSHFEVVVNEEPPEGWHE